MTGETQEPLESANSSLRTHVFQFSKQDLSTKLDRLVKSAEEVEERLVHVNSMEIFKPWLQKPGNGALCKLLSATITPDYCMLQNTHRRTKKTFV